MRGVMKCVAMEFGVIDSDIMECKVMEREVMEY